MKTYNLQKTNVFKMANGIAKLSEIWDSGVLVEDLRGTYYLALTLQHSRSFGGHLVQL